MHSKIGQLPPTGTISGAQAAGGHRPSCTPSPAGQCGRATPWRRRLSRRLYPWRLGLITVTTALLGGLVAAECLPLLPAETVTALLGEHLPGAEDTPFTYWFGLSLATVWPLCLLSLAGLTYFSGAITLGVIGIHTMAEGSVLSLLLQLRQGRLPIPAEMDAHPLLWVYALWMAAAWVLRGVVALRSRRTADLLAADRSIFEYPDAECPSSPSEGGTPPILPWHLAVTLGVILLHAAIAGLYTLLLYTT